MTVSYEVRSVSKRFAGVPAVGEASFVVEQGRVHGVIGKNGAGKSVLMNLIAGVFSASSGHLSIGSNDVDMKRWSPRLATDLGVALIPQEPPALPFMTVEDFLFMGDRTVASRGFLRRGAIRRKVAEIDERLSLRVLPGDPMATLPIEVQQRLSFGKAVYLEDAAVILLDEITASLSGPRREALLGQLRELSTGRSFTLISHRIGEIIAACDSVTVMRDGVSVQTVDIADTSSEELAASIVGDTDVHPHVTQGTRRGGSEVLRLRGVSSAPVLHDVDMTVHEHEVLGLSGVEGSGKDELLEVLAGLRRAEGAVSLRDRSVSYRSPRAAARGGMAYLPKKREELATIHGMSVLHNMVLPTARKLAGPLGFVREASLRRAGAPLAKQMQVKAPSLDADIDTLSGGNRQKVMLARLRLMTPSVFLLNEPTRGVDIATKPELLRVIREELTEGSAVVMTSESEEELVDTCDRVLVFVDGRVVRELKRDEADFTVGDIYRTGQEVRAL